MEAIVASSFFGDSIGDRRSFGGIRMRGSDADALGEADDGVTVCCVEVEVDGGRDVARVKTCEESKDCVSGMKFADDVGEGARELVVERNETWVAGDGDAECTGDGEFECLGVTVAVAVG